MTNESGAPLCEPVNDLDGGAIFITGASRSGTELMRSILNRHAGIHIAAETHYFADLRPRLDGLKALDAQEITLDYFGQLRGSAYGLGGAESRISSHEARNDLMEEAGMAGADRVFRAHCAISARDAGRAEASRWGEKTPRHIFCADAILDTFPGARIIHMLRDPRAVSASAREWRNHWYSGQEINPVLAGAIADETARVRATHSLTTTSLLWRSATSTAFAALRRHGPGRIRLQSFENLVACPDREIAAICEFLELEPSQDMMAARLVNSSYQGPDASTGFDTSTVSRWKSRLTEEEIWWIERLVGRTAIQAGYEPQSRRSHPGYGIRETLRTCRMLPKMYAANRGRAGRLLPMVASRLKGMIS